MRTKANIIVDQNAEGEKVASSKQAKRKAKKGKKELSPSKILSKDDWVCVVCNTNEEAKNWIECDRCFARFHGNCTKLTDNDFEWIEMSPHNEFIWFCQNCKGKEGKTEENISAILQSKLEEFAKRYVAPLQQKVDMLEKQNSKFINRYDGEARVSTDQQIKDHVEEVIKEQQEKEEKKNNIVLFGLQEGTETDEKQNKEKDLKKTKEIFSYVDPEVSLEKLNITNVRRIGKKSTDSEAKPRPIKIEMDCQDSKMNLLRSAKRLKDSAEFKSIGLSNDKTRKEQLEYKILKDKLAEKIKNKKEGEKYLIFRGQVVLESDIPAIRRKMKEEAGTGWASKAPVGGVPQGQAQGQGAEGKSDQVGAPPRH